MKFIKLITTITLSIAILFTPVLPVFASEDNLNKIALNQQIYQISQPSLLSTKTEKVSKVTLNKKSIAINLGTIETLTPTIYPSTATNKAVTWKSSNTKIATVDSEGMIVGIKAGKTTITATTVDKKKTAKCVVTVKNAPVVSVTGISLNKITTTINVGDIETLIPTISPNNATNKNVVWDTSNSSIATVDKNGKVLGIKEGLVYIYAVSIDGNKITTCDVTVDQNIAFKDKNLENVIRNKINKTSGDLKKSDIIDITILDAHSAGISDISGIENLTNLKEIKLYGNQISDITPLSGLVNLHDIRLGSNQISDISNLKGLYKLQTLSLFENKISDISPLSGLNNLLNLWLNDNQINNIEPLKKMRYLTWLDLTGNRISDADRSSLSRALPKCSILFGDSINIPVKITFVDINFEKAIRNSLNKQIGDITSSDVLEITKLSILDGELISDISGIENLTNLTEFTLYDSAVRDISSLADLTKLKSLDLCNNEITDISPLRNLSNLSVLSLNNILPFTSHKNRISDISAISGLTNLQSIEITSNQISNIDSLKGLRKLWNLNLRDNLISSADKISLRNALPNCTLMYL